MRVAYFGTWGRAGHFVRPIVGQFTKQEFEAFERVDLPAFHDAMLADGYAYCLYDDFWAIAYRLVPMISVVVV